MTDIQLFSKDTKGDRAPPVPPFTTSALAGVLAVDNIIKERSIAFHAIDKQTLFAGAKLIDLTVLNSSKRKTHSVTF